MELHGIEALAGIAGVHLLDDTSMARRPEPLVVHWHAGSAPPDALARIARAPAVTVLVAAPAALATVPAAAAAAFDVCLVAPADEQSTSSASEQTATDHGDEHDRPPQERLGDVGHVGDVGDPGAPWVAPSVGGPAALADLVAAVGAQPDAALALVALLRMAAPLDPRDAVVAEAMAYGMLIGGAGYRRWLSARRPPDVRPSLANDRVSSPPPDPESDRRPDHPRPRVRARREGDRLIVVLDRPEKRNAVDSALRDELVEALALADADRSITAVELRGAGPCFSAGGDLDEFGSVTDGPRSLAVRMTRHPGLAVLAVADRIVAHLHGPCVGAGIEVPAFAGHVVADPGATFRLPELGMGLVPGAGGTVSITRRIGRARTTWLALTGRTIDAPTALTWGLVDEIATVTPA